MSKVAVDLEEVLADTIRQSCKSTDKLSCEYFDSWDLDNYAWKVYNGVSDALWRHNPQSIPPVEPNLNEYMDELYVSADKLDIVTARLHVDESIRAWLAEQNILYDELVSTRQPKYELPYDLFIDDNPDMHSHCRLLLRHHSHNAQVPAEKSEYTDRIYSLQEAIEFL